MIHSKSALNLIFSCLLILLWYSTNAQNINIQRSTQSSCGSNKQVNYKGGRYVLQQSVGQQSVSGTIANNNLKLIQGYLQPNLRNKNATIYPTSLDVDIRKIPYTDQYIVFINEQSNSIHLSVYNTLGQKKYSQNIQGNQDANIDLSNYPAGCYILTIQTEQKHFSTKLIAH